MIVLIDNGHGIDTPGKRSVDGELLEYKYNREIAQSVYKILTEKYGCDVKLIVTEENDISLGERVRRINKYDKNNCFLVSIHCNAAGNGKEWTNATGWSVWTSRGQTKGDILADCMYNAAKEILTPMNKKIRTDFTDGDADYESDFYILKKSACPACLTENFFMDNKEDKEFLLSEEGKKAIVNIHVQGIIKFLEKSTI